MESEFTERELEFQDDLKEAEADAACRILKSEKGLEQVIHVADNASWFASTMRDKIVDPASPKIACKDKCHWCCHQSVGVSAPEVFRITKFIEEKISVKEKSKIVTRLKDLDKKSRGKSPAQRAKLNMPCAFLSFGRCQIYDARPLVCQRQTSYNVDDCKRAMPMGFPFGSVVSEKAQLVAYNGSIQGMLQGLNKMMPANDFSELDLTASVLDVLEDNSIPQKWLNGEACFSQCKLNT